MIKMTKSKLRQIDPSKIVYYDMNTTGHMPSSDTITSLSLIDGNKQVLFTTTNVEDEIDTIQGIFDAAEIIVGLDIDHTTAFLENAGIQLSGGVLDLYNYISDYRNIYDLVDCFNNLVKETEEQKKVRVKKEKKENKAKKKKEKKHRKQKRKEEKKKNKKKKHHPFLKIFFGLIFMFAGGYWLDQIYYKYIHTFGVWTFSGMPSKYYVVDVVKWEYIYLRAYMNYNDLYTRIALGLIAFGAFLVVLGLLQLIFMFFAWLFKKDDKDQKKEKKKKQKEEVESEEKK